MNNNHEYMYVQVKADLHMLLYWTDIIWVHNLQSAVDGAFQSSEIQRQNKLTDTSLIDTRHNPCTLTLFHAQSYRWLFYFQQKSQWRGYDFVIFIGQLPYLRDRIASVTHVSANNHNSRSNSDRTMRLASFCKLTQFSPLVILEFSNCFGIDNSILNPLIAAYNISCIRGRSSWIKVNFP